MNKETGGPAFPFDELNQQTGCVAVQHAGMTLRDYFAIHATEEDIQRHLPTGRIIEVVVETMIGLKEVEKQPEYRTIEQARYAFADAMLKARGQ